MAPIIVSYHRHKSQSWERYEMTIRTVEVTPEILVQGELINIIQGDPPRARVKCENKVYEGKLVECLRDCKPAATPYQ